jgi:hypothetical protein
LRLGVAVWAGGASLGADHKEEEAICWVCRAKVTRREEALLAAARSARVSVEK